MSQRFTPCGKARSGVENLPANSPAIAPGASAHLLNLTLMPNELWLFLERGLNGIARVADICSTYIPEMSILLPTPAGGSLRREHWSFTQLRPEMGERAQSLKALLMSPRTAMGSNPRNSEAPSRTPSIVPDAEHGRWLWAESSNVKARKQHRYRWGFGILFSTRKSGAPIHRADVVRREIESGRHARHRRGHGLLVYRGGTRRDLPPATLPL